MKVHLIERVLILCVVLAPSRAGAQATPRPPRAAAVITGTVYDSIARTPLADALVQLVAPDNPAAFSRSTYSDSAGRFTLRDVPYGRYSIGFLHPTLEALGVAPPLRELSVDGPEVRGVELAIPSARRVALAICRRAAQADSIATLVGVVRDAQSLAPVAGAQVAAAWLEFVVGTGGVSRRVQRLNATTSGPGWFALCDVPRGGMMQVTVSRGTDSIGPIELEVPRTGLLRRELYVGSARAMTIRDTTAPRDSLPPSEVRLLLGDGRLHGTVHALDGGVPVAGARVRVADGPQAVTNARGEWSLANLPTGTRTLEVRALGFYPERRVVDVISEAPSVRIAMRTMRAVLDTIRVTASRIRLEATGFAERRRMGIGRYLTAEEISRRVAMNTTDLVRAMPGVQVERTALGDMSLTIRGPFGQCSPAVYIDGSWFQGFTGEDIDSFLRPEEIAGVEVYTASVPPQFQPALTGCGSIVIWTKPRTGRRDR